MTTTKEIFANDSTYSYLILNLESDQRVLKQIALYNAFEKKFR